MSESDASEDRKRGAFMIAVSAVLGVAAALAAAFAVTAAAAPKDGTALTDGYQVVQNADQVITYGK